MRRMIAFAAAPLAVMALSACQPSNDAGAPASEPADAPTAAPTSTPAPVPADFTGDLDARGNEPFWRVTIRGDRITLIRPDHPELAVWNPGPKMAGDVAVWEVEGALTLGVRLRKATCSDGMSDLVYPLTAEVRAGPEALKGCGAKTAEMPRGE